MKRERMIKIQHKDGTWSEWMTMEEFFNHHFKFVRACEVKH